MSTSARPSAKSAAAKPGKPDPAQALGLCAVPRHPDPNYPANMDPNRLSAIVLNANKWANGTVLQYHFLDPAPNAQKDVVRKAFVQWKDQKIGLVFEETATVEDAEIRIAFQPGGSWSYVGTYNLQIPMPQATMNFGWDLTTGWGGATALHEIGHAIGLPHEHQNPQAGIVWDEEKVYEVYGRTQGWDREKIYYNVIRKIPGSEVAGTTWDPASIMHYPFERGLIRAPKPYDQQGTPENIRLSPQDVAFIRNLYPQLAAPTRKLVPMQLQALQLKSGEQADFIIEPKLTRTYTINTVGESDSKMVLFEERNGQPRFIAGDDDSAADRNARLRQRLVRGRKYLLRLRLHYVAGAEGFGVMMV